MHVICCLAGFHGVSRRWSDLSSQLRLHEGMARVLTTRTREGGGARGQGRTDVQGDGEGQGWGHREG